MGRKCVDSNQVFFDGFNHAAWWPVQKVSGHGEHLVAWLANETILMPGVAHDV